MPATRPLPTKRLEAELFNRIKCDAARRNVPWRRFALENLRHEDEIRMFVHHVYVLRGTSALIDLMMAIGNSFTVRKGMREVWQRSLDELAEKEAGSIASLAGEVERAKHLEAELGADLGADLRRGQLPRSKAPAHAKAS